MINFVAGAGDVWTAAEKILAPKTSLRAAIAYVSKGTPITFGAGCELIVDASDDAIKTAKTDAKVLQTALREGAVLYSYPNLHAKVIIADGKTLVTGSMNASKSSKSDLVEAAIITDDDGALLSANQWFDDLLESSDFIDDAFIRHIIDLPVEKSAGARRTRHRSPSSVYNLAPAWYYVMVTNRNRLLTSSARRAEKRLVAIGEDIPDDGASYEASYIIFSKPSKTGMRIKRGDKLFLGWRESNSSPDIWVYAHCLVRDVEIHDGRLIIYYLLSDDADNKAIRLSKFQKMAAKHQINVAPLSGGTLIPGDAAIKIEADWPS